MKKRNPVIKGYVTRLKRAEETIKELREESADSIRHICKMNNRLNEKGSTIEAYERLLSRTRAGRLLRRGRAFIVVDIKEQYYPAVYRMIRMFEQAKGTWTDRCEVEYRKKIDKWAEIFRAPAQFADTQDGCDMAPPKKQNLTGEGQ
jgi:hypothetical protein